MMKIYPTELRCVGPSRYAVRLDTTYPAGTYEFEFIVTGDDICVVETPPEFEALIHHNGGPAKGLLAAVLAFHSAQGAEIAD